MKLFVNGTYRGITIDEYLPVNKGGDLICAESSRGKLWVSLLEKAYVKLQGGYDFDGSRSYRDLYILTGWLPEAIKVSAGLDADKTWERIYKGT